MDDRDPGPKSAKDGGTQGIPIIINQIATMQTALQKVHQRLRSESTDRYANTRYPSQCGRNQIHNEPKTTSHIPIINTARMELQSTLYRPNGECNEPKTTSRHG